MKITPMLLLITIALTACEQSAPVPTVEELVANPERLKELREQCKTDRPRMGDVLCNRVAEATGRRFFNNGQPTPYTPPKEPPKF